MTAGPTAPGREVVVAGPGRMGVGIATAVLMAGQGHRVTLLDTKERGAGQSPTRLEKAREEIGAMLAGRRTDGKKIEGKHYPEVRTVTDKHTG